MAMLTDLQKMVAGMFMPASSTRNPQNVSGSIYDLARQQEQARALQRLGGGLMAASVPQTPLMRAQALQGAFSNMGASSTDTYNTAQMLLAEQKAKQQADREAKIAARLNEELRMGEGVAEGVSLPSSSYQPDFSTFGPRVQAPSAQAPAPQSEIGALISPAQAAIVAPPVPSSTNLPARRSGELTPAQLKRVNEIRDIDGPEAAYEALSKFRYENSLPEKPQGELEQGVYALRKMGRPQSEIDSFIRLKTSGQPNEFSRLVDEYVSLPEDNPRKAYLGQMITKQTAPEYYAPQVIETAEGTKLVQYPKSGVAGDVGATGGLADVRIKSAAEIEAEKKQAQLNAEKTAFQPKALRAIGNTEVKTADVMTAVERALKILREKPDSVTGLYGKSASLVPGTDAYNLQQAIETITANIGFDRLQAMRDASPTGGALGQVALQELSALQKSKGSLDIGQDPEVLIQTLVNIATDTDAVARSMYDAYEEDYGAGSIERNPMYSMEGIYAAPPNIVEALRGEFASEEEFKQAQREFDNKFGRGAAQYYLGGM